MSPASGSDKALPNQPEKGGIVALVGRVLGPCVALALYCLLPEHPALTDPGRATAAVGGLMAVWWMTEAIPLPVTALMPIILFPLAGVYTATPRVGQAVTATVNGEEKLGRLIARDDDGSMKLKFGGVPRDSYDTVPAKDVKQYPNVSAVQRACAPYADRFIFLFMGGFLLALGIEKCGLHRRIALLTLNAVGTRPSRLIAGFMLATGFLSMWISNTAATAMMLPIAVSVVTLLQQRLRSPLANKGAAASDHDARRFATCLMLGVAYSASVGGAASLVGTPTNAVLVSFLSSLDIHVGFAQWMLFALPLSLIFLVITWFMLTQVTCRFQIRHIPGGRELIRAELDQLGRMKRGEWTVLCVFLTTAALWIFRVPITSWEWLGATIPPLSRLNDTIIALFGGLLLFFLPVGKKDGKAEFAMDWEMAKRLPWGMLLLFGGGLSLAAAVSSSGLSFYLSDLVEAGLRNMPPIVLVISICGIVIFLTELTSNTPTATLFLPILVSFAAALKRGGTPIEETTLLIPAAMAASFAFMLPVATPPNAIVFASGHIRIGEMVKGGFWLNLIGIALITLAISTWGKWVF